MTRSGSSSDSKATGPPEPASAPRTKDRLPWKSPSSCTRSDPGPVRVGPAGPRLDALLRKRVRLQSAMFGIALGAGLAGSYFAESGLPSFPPARSDVWIGWLGPGLVIAALLAALIDLRRFPGPELFAILLGAAVACMPAVAWMAETFPNPPLFPRPERR